MYSCTFCGVNAVSGGDDRCFFCRRDHLRSNVSQLHRGVTYSSKQTGRGSLKEPFPLRRDLKIASKERARNAGSDVTEKLDVPQEILLNDQSKKTVTDLKPSKVTDSDTIHRVIKEYTSAISKAVRNADDAEVSWVSAQWPLEVQQTIKDNPDKLSQGFGSLQWVVDSKSSDCAEIPSLTWVKTIKMPILNFTAGCHITYVGPKELWVSDMKGHLFLMDLHGKVLETIKTRSGYGFHTVNQKRKLFYTDADGKHVIKARVKQKKLGIKISNVHSKALLKMSEWTPLCIYSSRHNGDLLVGMVSESRARVMRYDSSNKEKQEMEFDNKETPLYEFPQYVTENFNFDVITSDRTEVVAVDYSGRRRWSYSGSGKTGSGFLPAGICCDRLLNLVVYDMFDNRVHLLDKDGKYLSRLLVLGNAWIPQGLCFDEENHLYCGDRSKILVFKYENPS